MNKKKNILWCTWKDRSNPDAGGAETVNEELAKRLVKQGFHIIFLVAHFPGAKEKEHKDGYTIIRLGNKWTVYYKAYRYIKRHLKNWPDIIIDEMNTIPFCTTRYTKKRNILIVHQLCRKIWFHQMFFPLNIIGYLAEPLYLRVLKKTPAITISQSTKRDLQRYGFRRKNIHIIRVGIEIQPILHIQENKKFKQPTILSIGSIRPMKKTHHILKAFELLKPTVPNAQLLIAGSAKTAYGTKVLRMIEKSKYKNDIKYYGTVNEEQKISLLQQSHILCSTAEKEGWGLTVTEANSQGTPAIVYNTDGLRDSVKHNNTGIVCTENTPNNLAENITDLLKNKKKYELLQHRAWKWSKTINFDNSAKDFETILSNF